MADDKKGKDGKTTDGKDQVVPLEEFLRRLQEKAKKRGGALVKRPRSLSAGTPDEALLELMGCLNRLVEAHKALFALLEMHVAFIDQHAPEKLLEEYALFSAPLLNAYMDAMSRVLPPE
jgi:hypothetical protein